MLEDVPPEAERLYGGLIKAVRQGTRRIATETGIEPSEVAEVIGRALTANRPRARFSAARWWAFPPAAPEWAPEARRRWCHR